MSWWGEATFINQCFVLTHEGLNRLSDRLLEVPLDDMMFNGEMKIVKLSEIFKWVEESSPSHMDYISSSDSQTLRLRRIISYLAINWATKYG